MSALIYRLAAFILLGSLLSPLIAHAQYRFGDWELTHDESQCAARKITRAGTTLVFTHEPTKFVSIIAVNPTWTNRVKKGSTYRVVLEFDRVGALNDTDAGSIQIPGRGIGYSTGTDAIEPFMKKLSAANQMTLRVDGKFVEVFDLEGSDEIARSLTICDRD